MNFEAETAGWVATGILIALVTAVVYGLGLLALAKLRQWRNGK